MSESPQHFSWLRPSRQGLVDNVWAALLVAIPAALIVLLGAWLWNRYLDGPQVWDTIIFVSQIAFTALVPLVLLVAFRSLRATNALATTVSETPSADLVRAIVKEEIVASNATDLARVIDEAAAAGKFRPRPPEPPPQARFERSGFAVSARTWPEHIAWSDLREELRRPGMRGLVDLGAGLGGGRPVWVSVSIQLVEQGFYRGLVLELSGARARACSIPPVAQSLFPQAPGQLEVMDEGKMPASQRVIVNDLKTGEVWTVNLLCDCDSYGDDPPNFGWVLTGRDVSLAGSLKDILRPA